MGDRMVGVRTRDEEVLVSLDWLFCISMASFYWVSLNREILTSKQEGGGDI